MNFIHNFVGTCFQARKKLIKVVAETFSIKHPGTRGNNFEELLYWVEYLSKTGFHQISHLYVYQPNDVNQKINQYLSIRICDSRHDEYWSLSKFHLHEYKQNFVGLKVVPVYHLKYVNFKLMPYHHRKTFLVFLEEVTSLITT